MIGRANRWRAAVFALAIAAALPAAAADAPSLQKRVEAKLQEAGRGTRFGLVVASEDGRELIAIAPEQRFIPASNTKMFTTAAAFEQLGGIAGPDIPAGAAVRIEEGPVPDVVIEGRGDARLSSSSDCVTDCLATLADAVAARRLTVGDVIGDDSFFPDQRWSPGMSWNNMSSRYGTAASALTIDDNELVLRVRPSTPGKAPMLELLPYYEVDNRAVTVNSGPTALQFERFPLSNLVRLTGTIAVGSEPETLRLAIDDPAHYTAWRLKALLEQRGVRVQGTVAARHRSPRSFDDPSVRNGAPAPRPPLESALASLAPPPLAEDLRRINKESQNLHAELLLRRLGREQGTGSIADGLAAVGAMMERAGIERNNFDLYDGSGMSTYNRVAPRGMVRLLRWIAAQPWGAAWRSTLPVAGVDGTLASRFRGTLLEGKLFAKTGSLHATNALSGYMIARSGRTLLFSAYANDVPPEVSGTKALDAALLAIAEEN